MKKITETELRQGMFEIEGYFSPDHRRIGNTGNLEKSFDEAKKELIECFNQRILIAESVTFEQFQRTHTFKMAKKQDDDFIEYISNKSTLTSEL